jgi:hypothetical protein
VKTSCNTTSWSARVYRPGDEPGISELFRCVFGRTVPDSYWEWKYRSLPVGTENEWIAEADGRIIGHYAVTPIRFKLGNAQVLVPHGCDAMTHPCYRRQGILSALGRLANDVWKQAGAPFQIGFHYGGWGSVREALGWRPVVRLARVKRWIGPFISVAQQFSLPGSAVWRAADSVFNRTLNRQKAGARSAFDPDGIRVERVSRADDRFDRLWQKLSSAYSALAVRDRAWVQLRFLDMPGSEHQVILALRGADPAGYSALRITRDAGVARAAIADYFLASEDSGAAEALLREALLYASDMGARSLAALAIPESPLMHRLAKAGFQRGRHGFDFSIIPYLSAAEIPSCGWFVTGAEGDVV